MAKTSLIIPCYWASDRLVELSQECLRSLRYGRPDQVLVVDDYSPILPKLDYDGAHYLFRPVNGGYAAAVNTGLKKATGDILIVSNDDIAFTPGWLEAILKPLEMGYDISSIVTSDSGWKTEDKITEGDKFGSLWAMKRQVYETLGGLDENFVNYFEDLDYRRRAIIAGFKIAKNHAHVVEHEGRATFKEVDPTNHFYREAKQKYWDKWSKLDRKALADDMKGDPDFAHLL